MISTKIAGSVLREGLGIWIDLIVLLPVPDEARKYLIDKVLV